MNGPPCTDADTEPTDDALREQLLATAIMTLGEATAKAIEGLESRIADLDARVTAGMASQTASLLAFGDLLQRLGGDTFDDAGEIATALDALVARVTARDADIDRLAAQVKALGASLGEHRESHAWAQGRRA